MSSHSDELFDPLEEDTSPGVLEKHPGTESGKRQSAPPYADLQAQVQQLLGGHTQLRGVVDSMRRDLDTLLRESRQRERHQRDQEEQHGSTRRSEQRRAKLYGAIFVLAEAAQFWLHIHHGGHG